MKFTHNDWVHRDIINIIMMLTKRGANKIYNVLPKKYQKYHLTTILKYAKISDKWNKLPYKHLLDVPP